MKFSTCLHSTTAPQSDESSNLTGQPLHVGFVVGSNQFTIASKQSK